MFEPHRIVVTGGCGFIGSDFARMVALGHPGVRVTVLDKLTYAANPKNLGGLPEGSIELVVGDVCDARLLADVLPGHDAVVHFAAETHNDNAIAEPDRAFRSNAEGTLRLIEACTRLKIRYHHISMEDVFGGLPYGTSERFREDSPYRPGSPYAATKASSDMLVRAWARTYGLAATISNCSNNYGPYQHVEKFIPRQVTNLIDGVRPVLYGDGANVRDWIHVCDHSEAVWEVLTRGRIGETYLVGADGEHSNREVLAAILAAFGRGPDDFDRVPDRPGHDRRYAIDPSKLMRELGWAPRHTDFNEGLAQTIRWYRENEAWWRPVKAAVEERYARQARAR